MAKRLQVFVLRDAGWYHIRRQRDKTKTLCNKQFFDDTVFTTKQPKNRKLCDMCESLLSLSVPGKRIKRLAKRRKKWETKKPTVDPSRWIFGERQSSLVWFGVWVWTVIRNSRLVGRCIRVAGGCRIEDSVQIVGRNWIAEVLGRVRKWGGKMVKLQGQV